MGIKGDTRLIFSRMAKACSNAAAHTECLDVNVVAQEMVGAL